MVHLLKKFCPTPVGLSLGILLPFSVIVGLFVRFVGPTTVYAAMQACGVVDDHLATCPWRAAVEQARAALPAPGG